MTNENFSFDEWHDFLSEYATKKGGSAADADAWRDDYENGLTPEEAWREAWGDE
ncbi:TPA: hypothetical protein ACRR2J_003079 [Morganella morganii]|uniref:hypothetical protein n=1 Tax=Morganella morganii TaxID=582 RepID=UPI0027FD48F0|nr:hypothetical protein [Morganella morganii subsp. morganii]